MLRVRQLSTSGNGQRDAQDHRLNGTEWSIDQTFVWETKSAYFESRVQDRGYTLLRSPIVG